MLSDIKKYLVGDVFTPTEIAQKYDTTKVDAKVRLQMLSDDGYFREIKDGTFIPNTQEYDPDQIAAAFCDEFSDLREEGDVEPINSFRFH